MSQLESDYDRAFEIRKEAAQNFADALGGIREDEMRRSFLEGMRSSAAFGSEVLGLIRESEPGFSDTKLRVPDLRSHEASCRVVGLILVAIFAAAMSTVESELTSLSTATVVDFYRRYVRKEAEDSHFSLSAASPPCSGEVSATFCALYMGRLGSAIEAVNRIGSNFYGPILGVFVLAIGLRRANGHGAFAGVLLGIVAVQLTAHYSEISYLYYNLGGTVVSVVLGYLISLVFASSERSV